MNAMPRRNIRGCETPRNHGAWNITGRESGDEKERDGNKSGGNARDINIEREFG